jgi:hypothetical protein
MYIKELKKVQGRASELIKKMNKCSHENWVGQLDLPTIRYRRIRGVMTEIYKLVHCSYDSSSLLCIKHSLLFI